jgi:hypothetical protein
MTDDSATPSLTKMQALAEALRANIARVIVGKLNIIDLLLVALCTASKTMSPRRLATGCLSPAGHQAATGDSPG